MASLSIILYSWTRAGRANTVRAEFNKERRLARSSTLNLFSPSTWTAGQQQQQAGLYITLYKMRWGPTVWAEPCVHITPRCTCSAPQLTSPGGKITQGRRGRHARGGRGTKCNKESSPRCCCCRSLDMLDINSFRVSDIPRRYESQWSAANPSFHVTSRREKWGGFIRPCSHDQPQKQHRLQLHTHTRLQHFSVCVCVWVENPQDQSYAAFLKICFMCGWIFDNAE